VRRISTDGDIVLPLLGTVRMEGLDLPGAAVLLNTRFQDGFIKSPDVSIKVTDYQSKVLSFSGEVLRAGRYPIHQNSIGLIDALNVAGGLSIDAGEKIFITRNFQVTKNSDEKSPDFGDLKNEQDYIPRTLTILVSSLETKNSPVHQLKLMDGDIITVESSRNLGHVYVLGYVNRQGVFPLRATKIDAVKLLAEAGGIRPTARPENCFIIRPNAEGEEPLYISLDVKKITSGKSDPVFLLADDTLVVGSSFLGRASEFINPSAYLGVDGRVPLVP
jgi:polysaccharide export outer membrane protein